MAQLAQPPLSPETLNQLAAQYHFRQAKEVKEYLAQQPYLVPVLFEAADAIPRYFGEVPLILDTFTDPEDEEEHRELFALAQVTFTPEETLARMDRMDEEWWLEASPPGPGILVIDIEFA